MKDFCTMVKRASKGGLTTLNQLRVFLWLDGQPAAVTARECSDGTGVTPSQCTGIFKALEDMGHVEVEVSVKFSYGVRRSQLVAELTPQGKGWLQMILMEVAG